MDFSYREPSQAPSRTGSASGSWNPPPQPAPFSGWPQANFQPLSQPLPVIMPAPLNLTPFLQSSLGFNTFDMQFPSGVMGVAPYNSAMPDHMNELPQPQVIQAGFQMGHLQPLAGQPPNTVPRRDQGIIFPSMPNTSHQAHHTLTNHHSPLLPYHVTYNNPHTTATPNVRTGSTAHQSAQSSPLRLNQQTVQTAGTSPTSPALTPQQLSHLHPQNGPLSAPLPLGERRRIHNHRHSRTITGSRISSASHIGPETRTVSGRSRQPPPIQPNRRVQSLDGSTDELNSRAKQNFHRKLLIKFATRSLQPIKIADMNKEDRTCNICYNEFGVDSPEGIVEQPLRIPICNHIFGTHCIQKWLMDKDTCPYCRRKVLTNQVMAKGQAFLSMMRLQNWTESGTPDEIFRRFYAGDQISHAHSRHAAGTRRSAPEGTDEQPRVIRRRLSVAGDETTDAILLAGHRVPRASSPATPITAAMMRDTMTAVQRSMSTSSRSNRVAVSGHGRHHSISGSSSRPDISPAELVPARASNVPTPIRSSTSFTRSTNVTNNASVAPIGITLNFHSQSQSQPRHDNPLMPSTASVGTQTFSEPAQAAGASTLSTDEPTWSFMHNENWL